MLILCQNCPFSKKHSALMPIFCKKRSILSKTQCFHVIFSKFLRKTPAVIPILDQKMSILSKLQYYMGQKVNTMPFFLFFMKKYLLSCPYLVQKTSILSKLHYIMGQKCRQNALVFKKNTRKYPIITAKKVKYHFKIHYNIKQKNVKNLKKYNNILKYGIMYTKKKNHKTANIIFSPI